MIFLAVGIILWIVLPFIIADTVKESRASEKLGKQILSDCNSYIENYRIKELEKTNANDVESTSEFQGNLNLF